MKKLLCFGLLLSLTLPVCTFAVEETQGTISTDAVVNREILPDTVKIRFYVENFGMNVADIKSKNDKIVSDAISAINALLSSDEYVKTIAFSVNNVYSYKDKVRIFQKYQVRNGFEVKLKDLSKISSVIKTAMAQGVKNVGDLNFSIENSDIVCNELMADAARLAQKKAKYIAESVNAPLDKIKSINPYCSLNSSYVQPRRYNKMMTMDAASGAGVEEEIESIEAGPVNVRANVNMIYYSK